MNIHALSYGYILFLIQSYKYCILYLKIGMKQSDNIFLKKYAIIKNTIMKLVKIYYMVELMLVLVDIEIYIINYCGYLQNFSISMNFVIEMNEYINNGTFRIIHIH